VERLGQVWLTDVSRMLQNASLAFNQWKIKSSFCNCVLLIVA
jgi:hypothetical protein